MKTYVCPGRGYRAPTRCQGAGTAPLHRLWLVPLLVACFLSLVAFVYADEDAVSLGSITLKDSILSPHLVSHSMTAREADDLPTSSLLDPLTYEGVDLQTRAPMSGVQSDLAIRGSNFQQVLMLVNGYRMNDPQTAHHNADIPLTQFDYEQIEVLPGASSASLGPDGLGGAVNTVLRKPLARRVLAEQSFGSFGFEETAVSAEAANKTLGGRFAFDRSRSKGFQDATDFDTQTMSGTVSAVIPDGNFLGYFGEQEKEFGAYDFYTPGKGYPSGERTKTYLALTQAEVEKGELIIRPAFLWRRHYDRFMLDRSLIKSRFVSDHHTDVFTPTLYFQKEFESLGKIGFGSEFGEERIISTTLSKHDRSHTGFFTDYKKIFNDRIRADLSGRFDDYPSMSSFFTGSAVFRYEVTTDHYLGAGIVRGVRVPSFTELYYTDPTTVGQPNLTEESAWTYEVSHEHRWGDVKLDQTFFLRHETNRIDWIKHSISETRWQAANIGSADVPGIETSAKVPLWDTVSLGVNYTYLDRLTDDAGIIYKYGPNYARHLLGSTLTWKLPFGVQSVECVYKGKKAQEGFCLLNFHFAVKLHKTTEVFLNVDNALNTSYEEIPGIPQPGRWIWGGVRVSF